MSVSSGLLLALLSVLAPAAPSRVAPRQDPLLPGGLPPTRLAEELLVHRPLVARGRTTSVRTVGLGTAVVRFAVSDVLWAPPGVEVGPEVVIFAYAGHFRAGSDDLVYLLPHGRAGRWRLLQRIDGQDPDASAKRRVSRETLALTDVAPERLWRATLDQVESWIGSPEPWVRAFGLSELTWIGARHWRHFSQRDLQGLAALAAMSPWPRVREGVESVTRRVRLQLRSLPEDPQPESSPR